MTRRVLFAGPLRTQSLTVWLQPYGSGIGLLSHELGPELVRFFGTDELETFLVIEEPQLPALAAALRGERTDADPPDDAIALLADRHAGDAMATTHLRAWLTEQGIAHTFAVV